VQSDRTDGESPAVTIESVSIRDHESALTWFLDSIREQPLLDALSALSGHLGCFAFNILFSVRFQPHQRQNPFVSEDQSVSNRDNLTVSLQNSATYAALTVSDWLPV